MRSRGFASLQLVAVLGVVLALAGSAGAAWVFRLQRDAEASARQVAEVSMANALQASAAKQRAIEVLEAERERAGKLIRERDRAVRALRGEAAALEQRLARTADDDDCAEVLRARLCGAVADLLRGDAAAGGDGAGGAAGDAAGAPAAPAPGASDASRDGA